MARRSGASGRRRNRSQREGRTPQRRIDVPRSNQMDALNPSAMAGLGLAMAAQERDLEALEALRRAREFGAGGTDVLIAMAQCAARLDRRTAALGYLEQALALDPKNFTARRAMKTLGRAPKSTSAPDVSIQRNKRK